MPEVRTHLGVELHRKLKGEAVSKGMPLKQLIADVLEEHAREQGNGVAVHRPPKNKRQSK